MIKKKKAIINPKNTDNKSFQYAVTVALNYEEIESHPEGVSNIKPFINRYNWKGINYPSKIDDWKTFEKNNPTIALNILYTKEKERCPAYISKNNSNFEKQIILLMISNKEKRWQYLAIKKLSALLHGITSVPAIWEFDHIEDKHTLHRGKDCMKKCCTSLREHAKNIIDFEKKKMLPIFKKAL